MFGTFFRGRSHVFPFQRCGGSRGLGLLCTARRGGGYKDSDLDPCNGGCVTPCSLFFLLLLFMDTQVRRGGKPFATSFVAESACTARPRVLSSSGYSWKKGPREISSKVLPHMPSSRWGRPAVAMLVSSRWGSTWLFFLSLSSLRFFFPSIERR